MPKQEMPGSPPTPIPGPWESLAWDSIQFQVSLGPQQTWMHAPESQGFLGYQAREDRKEPWGFLA